LAFAFRLRPQKGRTARAKIFAFRLFPFATQKQKSHHFRLLVDAKSLTSQPSSMFVSRSAVSRVMSASARSMSTKVAVLGAAGGIGQPLSMLLKLSSAVDELSCYDVRGSPGVAADLSHVSSHSSTILEMAPFLTPLLRRSRRKRPSTDTWAPVKGKKRSWEML
jgi:hypothetical protein